MTQDEFEDFLDNWLNLEFCNERQTKRIRARMVALYKDDPPYWAERSLWSLFDATRVAP